MSYNNLLYTGMGFGFGAAWVYGAHYSLRKSLIVSHCLVNEYRDTCDSVGTQLYRLADEMKKGISLGDVYCAVLRHENTLETILESAEKQYNRLCRGHRIWSTSYLHRTIRLFGMRFNFEDFVETGPTGKSEADRVIDKMRRVRQCTHDLRVGMETLYPELKVNPRAVKVQAPEIRRELVLSFPR